MSARDNPILNSPYEEPKRHYSTDAGGNLNYKRVAVREVSQFGVTPCPLSRQIGPN